MAHCSKIKERILGVALKALHFLSTWPDSAGLSDAPLSAISGARCTLAGASGYALGRQSQTMDAQGAQDKMHPEKNQRPQLFITHYPQVSPLG